MARLYFLQLWFSPFVLPLLLISSCWLPLQDASGQQQPLLVIWHLNQSFSITASSPAFPDLPQPTFRIFPFFPEVQQVSNASLNASSFIFPCFLSASPAASQPSLLSSTILGLCMSGVSPYQDPSSPLQGFPAIIWRANRLSPARGKTISLSLEEDGDLVVRGVGSDGVETVAWRSNTSGLGVTRMELWQEPATLILYDTDNSTVWQSMDFPADTLTVGQPLQEGMKLISYASPENISDGEYSLELNETAQQLTLLFKHDASSLAIPYWLWQANSSTSTSKITGGCGPAIVTCNIVPLMDPYNLSSYAAFISPKGFSVGDPSAANENSSTAIPDLTYTLSAEDIQTTILRLDTDGSLRLLSIKKTWVVLADLFSAEAACSLPLACGSYGICVGNKQCKCPDVHAASSSTLSPLSSSFEPSDSNDPSQGCKLTLPLPACINATIATNAQTNSSTTANDLVHMQLLEGVDYFSNLPDSALNSYNVSNGENCSNFCLLSCTCIAAFWRADVQVCSHIALQQLGSLRGGLNSSIYKAYLKVSLHSPAAPPSSLDSSPAVHKSKVATGVGISIAALFAITSICLFFLWHKHRNRKSVDENVLGDTPMLKLPPRYSYTELYTATNGFSNLLGKGGFGSVYAGVLGDDSTKVAVKKLEGMRQGEKEFKTELAIMGGIHHYNLLQLTGYCAEGADRRLLVYKYMENGSLDQWLFAPSSTLLLEDEAKQHAMTRLKWGVRYAIALGVARGLAYLHDGCEKRIIHLDIKPQNILLDDGFVAKVADFGLSRGMEREESHVVTTMRGTPGYLAPEWMKDGTIDVKCDVFSFGMLLMEIVSGRKNIDMRNARVPVYPEWAYSKLVSAKLQDRNAESNEPTSRLRNTNENSSVHGKPYLSLHKMSTINELTDATLESEEERAQVWRFLMTAFLCVLERPEWRPPMARVVHMLEGHISLSNIDLSYLHHALIFVLGSHKSSCSGSHAYNNKAVVMRREFQEQLESILALSGGSPPTSFSAEEYSQVSAR